MYDIELNDIAGCTDFLTDKIFVGLVTEIDDCWVEITTSEGTILTAGNAYLICSHRSDEYEDLKNKYSIKESVHPVDYLEEYIRINFGEEYIKKEYLDQLRAICDEEVEIKDMPYIQSPEQAKRIGKSQQGKLNIKEVK